MSSEHETISSSPPKLSPEKRLWCLERCVDAVIEEEGTIQEIGGAFKHFGEDKGNDTFRLGPIKNETSIYEYQLFSKLNIRVNIAGVYENERHNLLLALEKDPDGIDVAMHFGITNDSQGLLPRAFTHTLRFSERSQNTPQSVSPEKTIEDYLVNTPGAYETLLRMSTLDSRVPPIILAYSVINLACMNEFALPRDLPMTQSLETQVLANRFSFPVKND